ncbi:MAG: class II fructose-bisphosphate aldolase, partial [Clostridia bacterium]
MLMDLKQIMSVAQANGFAVPAFNVSSDMLLRAVMEGCEADQAPVIIAVHPNELAFVGDAFMAAVRESACKANIPVCIHLDHGATFEQVIHAIACGFTSVMIDASIQSFEDNIALTRKVVEAAHAAHVTVEAELGTIGATGNGGEAGTEGIIYTNPSDAEIFVKQTGIDALAVAIGT